MKDAQLDRLLEIKNISRFHTEFEEFMGMDDSYRKTFPDTNFLWKIRVAFLYESYALHDIRSCEKTGFLLAAIETLKNLPVIPNHPVSSLYGSHYRAKLQYQLGVIWTEVHKQHKKYQNQTHVDLSAFFESIQNWGSQHHLSLVIGMLCISGKSYLQLAMEAFETGIESYQSFNIKHALLSNKDFATFTHPLYQNFQELDEYSPCARLISLHYNHYSCSQEDKTATRSERVMLEELLDIHQQQIKSSSNSVFSKEDQDAVNNVRSLLSSAKEIEFGINNNSTHKKRKNTEAFPETSSSTRSKNRISTHPVTLFYHAPPVEQKIAEEEHNIDLLNNEPDPRDSCQL